MQHIGVLIAAMALVLAVVACAANGPPDSTQGSVLGSEDINPTTISRLTTMPEPTTSPVPEEEAFNSALPLSNSHGDAPPPLPHLQERIESLDRELRSYYIPSSIVVQACEILETHDWFYKIPGSPDRITPLNEREDKHQFADETAQVITSSTEFVVLDRTLQEWIEGRIGPMPDAPGRFAVTEEQKALNQKRADWGSQYSELREPRVKEFTAQFCAWKISDFKIKGPDPTPPPISTEEVKAMATALIDGPYPEGISDKEICKALEQQVWEEGLYEPFYQVYTIAGDLVEGSPWQEWAIQNYKLPDIELMEHWPLSFQHTYFQALDFRINDLLEAACEQ